MKIIALDPGTRRSAWVILETDTCDLIAHGQSDNKPLRDRLATLRGVKHLVSEDIVFMGMSVGKDVFATAKWIGIFTDVWPGEYTLVPRVTVKSRIAGSSRAKDPQVRAGCMRRFGLRPGRVPKGHILSGIVSHEWSALAVALWYADKVNAPKQLRLGDS